MSERKNVVAVKFYHAGFGVVRVVQEDYTGARNLVVQIQHKSIMNEPHWVNATRAEAEAIMPIAFNHLAAELAATKSRLEDTQKKLSNALLPTATDMRTTT